MGVSDTRAAPARLFEGIGFIRESLLDARFDGTGSVPTRPHRSNSTGRWPRRQWSRPVLHRRVRRFARLSFAPPPLPRRRATRRRANGEQEQAREQHGGIQSDLVKERPEPDFGRCGHRLGPGAEEHREFAGGNRDEHIDNERNCRQPRGQPQGEQDAADDLDDADEARQELRGGDPQLGKPAGTLVGVEELDQARDEEDTADGQPDQNRRRRRGPGTGAEEPS